MSRGPSIPLPRDWSAHVRAAFLHAVSLAHAAVTYSRGWCADSPIARVRLAGENDRLKSEVGLLREELRIKDARLARIEPRHRPHYPPTERLAILALRAARVLEAFLWSSSSGRRGDPICRLSR
jgi:hypothetical protein